MNQQASMDPGFLSCEVTRMRRFYFGRSPISSRGETSVAGGGWELVAPDYSIDRTSFPWLAIEFVAGGQGTLHLSGIERRLQRGVAFAYGPQVAHRIETDSANPLSKYYLNFSGREVADLMAAVPVRPGECRMMSHADELEEALEALIDEGLGNRSRAPVIVSLQLRILLLKMSDWVETEAPAERRSLLTLKRCVEHIDRNFLEICTIQEVAEACHLSVGHLTRSFARHGYGSPYQYLVRRKMLHAAALLDSGMFMVREVADRLSLDPFQFSRIFKRVHGISPSDFVKRHGVASQNPQSRHLAAR